MSDSLLKFSNINLIFILFHLEPINFLIIDKFPLKNLSTEIINDAITLFSSIA